MSQCKHCKRCVSGAHEFCACCGRCQKCDAVKLEAPARIPIPWFDPYPAAPHPYPITEPYWLKMTTTTGVGTFSGWDDFAPFGSRLK